MAAACISHSMRLAIRLVHRMAHATASFAVRINSPTYHVLRTFAESAQAPRSTRRSTPRLARHGARLSACGCAPAFEAFVDRLRLPHLEFEALQPESPGGQSSRRRARGERVAQSTHRLDGLGPAELIGKSAAS